MGSRFTGALAYADDITLLAPCKSCLTMLIVILLTVVQVSYFLFFIGRHCNTRTSNVMVNGQIVHITDTSLHLGQSMSSRS